MRYYCIILIFLIACNDGSDTEQAQGAVEKSPVLIGFSHEYLMNEQEYNNDHENFTSKYFSVDYRDTQIVATTLIRVGCIDSVQGKIEVSNDTIYLIRETIMTDDRYCPEYHKFRFVISNPNNIKYNIISTK
ncbi:MAG: hypothetical protein WDZ35_08495 [Crocinitomicaceae bacterium]